MKKQYKAPLTEVVKINAEQLICQSIAGVESIDGLFVDNGNEFSGGVVDAKEDLGGLFQNDDLGGVFQTDLW